MVELPMTAAVAQPSMDNPVESVGALAQVAPDFAGIYQEHSRAIFYLCLRMLGEEARAEDATHDVFLKAWRHRAEFQGRSSWRTWLYRIGINHCRNLQQTWAERHISTTDDEFVLQSTLPDTDSPLRVLEIKELGERIQGTLERLPDEYRLLLLLVADEEMSYDEVAELTRQSPDAVRGKLHRARKAFALEFRKTE
jgi:RNA polymerase sigma-70 factor (ECF subfamily)